MANTNYRGARRAYPCALATALHLWATGCDGGVDISIQITSPEPPCGDGEVAPGEECDDGAANGDDAACKLDCTLNVCGDGHVGPNRRQSVPSSTPRSTTTSASTRCLAPR